MMDKVWIVTEGSYSDYHIVAVFSSEEKAKEYVETYGEEDSYSLGDVIEEWDVDVVDDLPKGMKYYKVYYTPRECKITLYLQSPTESSVLFCEGRWLTPKECVEKQAYHFYNRSNVHQFIAIFLARDADHAAKQCTQMYQNLKQHGGLKE